MSEGATSESAEFPPKSGSNHAGVGSSAFDWGAVRDHYRDHRCCEKTAARFGLTTAAVRKQVRIEQGDAISDSNEAAEDEEGIPCSTVPGIPGSISDWGKLEAVRFYLPHLEWAVHPLQAPDQGGIPERGKKPLLKGWRDHRSTDVLMDDLEATFAEGTSYNLGVVMRPPYVAADLDSKPDLGESVRAWLAENPELSRPD